MNHREHITRLFVHLAQRHPLVLHDPDADTPRFFEEEEWDRMMHRGTQLAAKDWTVVLEEYAEEFYDNGGDYTCLQPHIAFMVGRHVPPASKQSAYSTAFRTARDIAKAMVGKLNADALAGCDADLPQDLPPPATVFINSVRIIPIKLPLFDEAYGARCTFRIRTDAEEQFTAELAEWLPLEEEEPEEEVRPDGPGRPR